MDLLGELPLRVGDVVVLRPGAPVAGYAWLQAGLNGRVLIAEASDERDLTGEVTVVFTGHKGRPIRLHRRCLHLISRPRGRGRQR